MRAVRLADEVGIDSVIRGKRYEDDVILGPAVVALLGDVTIENCSFDGDEESFLIEVPDGRRVIGVIGLEDTSFRRCRFQNVSVIGTRETLEPFRKDIALTAQRRLGVIPQG